MSKSFGLFFMAINLICINTLAQVTIGMGEAPEKAALLQLKDQIADPESNVTSTRGGLLLPRVRLMNTNTLEPFLKTDSPEYTQEKRLSIGLLVYNVYTSEDKSLIPGCYIWNGEQWESTRSHTLIKDETESYKSSAVKIDVNQSDLVTLSGSQSYGLLLKNQRIKINPKCSKETSYANNTKDASSVITYCNKSNSNDDATLLDAPYIGKANVYRINLQFAIGNNPPKETSNFDISIITATTGELIFKDSIIIPGNLNTGHIVHSQISFSNIADADTINTGYRIIFSTDTATSHYLTNNVQVKITDIVRINL